MLQRARRDALKGKRIVIVGAGYEGKRPIFVRAKELGVVPESYMTPVSG